MTKNNRAARAARFLVPNNNVKFSYLRFWRQREPAAVDVLRQPDWDPLNYSYKLVLLKLMHKAFYDKLPQVLSRNIGRVFTSGFSSRLASYKRQSR